MAETQDDGAVMRIGEQRLFHDAKHVVEMSCEGRRNSVCTCASTAVILVNRIVCWRTQLKVGNRTLHAEGCNCSCSDLDYFSEGFCDARSPDAELAIEEC